MRSLWLSAAVAYAALLAPAAASVAASALSVDASAGLRAAQLSLTSALLDQPALLEELCAIPRRGADPLHHWAAEELHQLQWPPLMAAAGEAPHAMLPLLRTPRHGSPRFTTPHLTVVLHRVAAPWYPTASPHRVTSPRLTSPHHASQLGTVSGSSNWTRSSRTRASWTRSS